MSEIIYVILLYMYILSVHTHTHTHISKLLPTTQFHGSKYKVIEQNKFVINSLTLNT